MAAAKFISEPIKVIAYMDGMKMTVIRFKWNETVYNVSKMVNKWKVPMGDNMTTHYIVECPKQDVSCELALDHTDLKWILVTYSGLR